MMRLGQTMPTIRKECELYGSGSCPYTRELRADLEWRRVSFVEYDVDVDTTALRRLRQLTPGQSVVPVLVENGVVRSVGWQGRTCVVGPAVVRRTS
jgi:glutaredoxin